MADLPTDSTLLELYRLAVDQADRISARRATANSYFLTLQTGMVAFVSVLSSTRTTAEGKVPRVDDFALMVTAAAGGILAIAWWLLLRSYRDLNSAKFKVITEMESRLPIALFSREWEILKADEPLPWWKGRYAELGFVERVVPVVYLGVYVLLAARVWST